jgi:hypothetical protein
MMMPIAGCESIYASAFQVKRQAALTPSAPDRQERAPGRRSGDDIGEKFILHPGDLVLKVELLFLETLDLKVIGATVRLKAGDRAVQIAMFLFELRQRRPQPLITVLLHPIPLA